MIVHFICRGNSFRSLIAESYLNSLEISGWRAVSSGSTAVSAKVRNLVYYKMTLALLGRHGIRGFAKTDYGDQLTRSRLEETDLAVCMYQRVYDECLRIVDFPVSPLIWSVADVGEPGRIAHTEPDEQMHREQAYQEIARNVDRLVSHIPLAS